MTMVMAAGRETMMITHKMAKEVKIDMVMEMASRKPVKEVEKRRRKRGYNQQTMMTWKVVTVVAMMNLA